MPLAAVAAIDTDTLRRMYLNASRNVALNRDLIDRMNVFPVPDGDTGTNMTLTLKKMEASLAEPSASPSELARKAARAALMGARGNSGVILSQILRGFADGLEPGDRVTPMQLAHALANGADCAYQAVIKPVEGTILTVAKDASTAALIRASEGGAGAADVLDAAVRQAGITLAKTPQLLDKLRQAGVVDSGGQGLVCFLQGFRSALLGEAPAAVLAEQVEARPEIAEAEELKYQYCTEINLIAAQSALPKLRRLLEIDTDSLLVVGDDDMIHVHVHTNDPGSVLSHAVKFGELADVKVDNMRIQHNERIHELIEETPEKISVVAVVSGDGMKDIYSSLVKTVHIVEGGQSMNPSAEELLHAVNAARARDVVLLPNNPNIMLAASKVKDLTSKRVHVVPTATAAHGVAALVEFDPEKPVDTLVKSMKKTAVGISVAEITRAVRDSRAGGVEIKKGDVIVIFNEKITAAVGSVEDALRHTVEKMSGAGAEVVTLYSGAEISGEEAAALAEKLRAAFSGIEIELHPGGQPLYPFIVSGE